MAGSHHVMDILPELLVRERGAVVIARSQQHLEQVASAVGVPCELFPSGLRV